MNSSAVANISSENATGSSKIVPSLAEGQMLNKVAPVCVYFFLCCRGSLFKIIFNCLINVYDIPIPLKFYHLVNVTNYSDSYANPVVYASLRILELREAMVLCCFGGRKLQQTWKLLKKK